MLGLLCVSLYLIAMRYHSSMNVLHLFFIALKDLRLFFLYGTQKIYLWLV